MKKRALLAMCVLVAACLATTAVANCGGCGAGAGKTCPKAAAKAAATRLQADDLGCPMGRALASLDLTEKQQTKINAARAKCKAKIEKILTPDQREKVKAACAARSKKCNKARKCCPKQK